MKEVYRLFMKPKDPLKFDAVKIMIASPERIREWSYGEVKKPETINSRTFTPERDGLFCARIFGPIKDYECNCGKYKRQRHRGVVCEKCGVEVIQSKVRRERLGHVELAAPVAHIWFVRSLPSVIGNLLDLTLKELEETIYFDSYIVLDPGETSLSRGELLTEEEYRQIVQRYPNGFTAGIGAEAIKQLLSELDLDRLAAELREEMLKIKSIAQRNKITNRLKIIDAFRESENRPEWMIMDVIPVLPPDLRPLVPLDGGRFATSDLNDLYRRVINRNNRLKRLMELNAPDIIIRNEKLMLQEAVDVLFDNGRRGKTVRGFSKRPLKSLSDMLKGKQGRFRQNLLGKRVDFSGRTVIVVGPNLRLHQCGLPRKMAIELFRPFIYNKLVRKGYTTEIKAAKKMVEKETPEVWDTLDEIVREFPVMLNHAPTLHRLGIQAFEPILIEGKAIQLHPLVCSSFNVDFDGDQMAVHIPLSIEAQVEARVLMMSTNNILSPADGDPIIIPSQDILLGIYYMTREKPYAKGEGRCFAGREEVRCAYDLGDVELHAQIQVRISGERVKTTVGRILLSEILPEELPFAMINQVMNKKALAQLIKFCYRLAGVKATVLLADRLKDLGLEFATRSGLSFAITDIVFPRAKQSILENVAGQVKEIEGLFNEGFLAEGQWGRDSVDVWVKAVENMAVQIMTEMASAEIKDPKGNTLITKSFNPIFMMVDSGAHELKSQMNHLGGICGLVANSSGNGVTALITGNLREGLTPYEYFLTTSSRRKELFRESLDAASATFLMQRLLTLAQDVIVTDQDCGTVDGIDIQSLSVEGKVVKGLSVRILGRIASENIYHPTSGELLLSAGCEIDEQAAQQIEKAGVVQVSTRSVLTCRCARGVCAMCYGRDHGQGRLVEIGEAIGILAAQSIGELARKFSTRVFLEGKAVTDEHHPGPDDATAEIVQSFPESGVIRTDLLALAELLEARRPRICSVISEIDGVVTINLDDTGRYRITVTPFIGDRRVYSIPRGSKIIIRQGDYVLAGEPLVDGVPDPHSILAILGEKEAARHLVEQIQFIFLFQGMRLNDKHIEVIVRQMMKCVRIIDPRDSEFLRGQVVEKPLFEATNGHLHEQGKRLAAAEPLLLGITKASLVTQSFIAAASQKGTSRVLTTAAAAGKVDYLLGFNERMLLGKMILAGTGLRRYRELSY